MPKFAIIVPMYNAAETVAATIQSVLDQTVADWELYLADDGSDDGTVAAAAAAAGRDPRVKIIECGRIANACKIRNSAIGRAHRHRWFFCSMPTTSSARTSLRAKISCCEDTGAAIVHSAADHLVGQQIVQVQPTYRGPIVCDPPWMLASFMPEKSCLRVVGLDRARCDGGRRRFQRTPRAFRRRRRGFVVAHGFAISLCLQSGTTFALSSSRRQPVPQSGEFHSESPWGDHFARARRSRAAAICPPR